jgi:hypothetical protein
MNKEFIPYEQALALKELGFKEECSAHFLDVDDLELKWKIYRNLSVNINNCLQAPLYQQAFRFFREKHGCSYSIGRNNDVVIHIAIAGNITTFFIEKNKSYEQAELECVKKLIELVKNKLIWKSKKQQLNGYINN